MVGINECGTGTPESFFERYRQVLENIREIQPDALIFIQANLTVTKEKSAEEEVVTNENISARNTIISQLANQKDIFYIDVNESSLCEDGILISDYTWDQVHIKAQYYTVWKDFLLQHAIIVEDAASEESDSDSDNNSPENNENENNVPESETSTETDIPQETTENSTEAENTDIPESPTQENTTVPEDSTQPIEPPQENNTPPAEPPQENNTPPISPPQENNAQPADLPPEGGTQSTENIPNPPLSEDGFSQDISPVP